MTARARVRKVGDLYLGSLTFGCPDCGGIGDTGGDAVITVGAFGESKADALHKAALVAERISTDPVLQAIMPPGTASAIMATKALAVAAKKGSPWVAKWFRRFGGPGVERVVKALHDESAKTEVGVAPLAIFAAQAARKYGPGVVKKLQAMRKARKASKARKKAAARKRAAVAPPSAPSPAAPQTDEEVMNQPPHPDMAPMPEDALGPLPAPYADNDDGGEYDDGGGYDDAE